MEKLYFYEVYYESTLIGDSRSRGKVFGEFFETREQAEQSALDYISDYVEKRKESGGWTDYDDPSDFFVSIGKICEDGEIIYK